MRPDVCLISPYPEAGTRHGGHSGVASYTANLAHALSERGLAVSVVAPRDGSSPELYRDEPVEVIRAFDPGPAALPAAFAAALRTGAPTLHLQHETFLYGGPASVAGLAPGLALAKRRGGAVVTMHHAVDPGDVDAEFMRLHEVAGPRVVARAGLAGVRASITRLARAVIVHEQAFAGHVHGATVIPHGIETAVPRAGGRGACRRELGLGPEEFVALCFGFIAPYKGLETSIKAAALAGEGIRLIVAGGEHPRLGSYGRRLRLQLPDAASFVGRVPDRDVGSWFAAADVALFMYPRPFAASGALALALSHRTPPLLSAPLAQALGAADELAVEADPIALAHRLRRLRFDRTALERLRAEAGRLAADRSWERSAERHIAVYEEDARRRDRPLPARPRREGVGANAERTSDRLLRAA